MRANPVRRRVLPVLAGLLAGACGGTSGDITEVKHVVVIYMENHSFDNLYGSFPGANGLTNAASFTASNPQVDVTGTAYTALPFVASTSPAFSVPSTPIANGPFLLDTVIPNIYNTGVDMPDLVHRFYQEQAQIHGGKNDRYVMISDAKGLSMGYYDTTRLPMYSIAKQYTVADNFFAAAFGGSFLNHQWLIAAQSPKWEGSTDPTAAPISFAESKYNPTATCYPASSTCTTPVVVDGQFVTFSGDSNKYLVNTVQPTNIPHAGTKVVPRFTNSNIGDELTAAGVDWAWYAGGWNDAIAGNPAPTFQYHHQPFNYYANYADGTAAKSAHLLDETDFDNQLASGTVKPVSFIKFLGSNNEHPGYADLITGDQHLADKVNAIMKSSIWNNTVIIITYDEFGGQWDHVTPPTDTSKGKADKWGPGTRVPALIISPFAKKGYVDHTEYDTTSILAFIEKRFKVNALSSRDAAADPFTGALSY